MPEKDVASTSTAQKRDISGLRFVLGKVRPEDLRAALLLGKSVLVSQPEGLEANIIPEPRLGAWGDWEPVTIQLGELSVKLLRQTYHNVPRGEGNCAQYSAMNAAKICHELSLSLHPRVKKYYDENPNMSPNTVEHELILPLLFGANESPHIRNIQLSDDRKAHLLEELKDKAALPTKSLDNVNAVLLLQEMFNPEGDMQKLIFDENELDRPDDFGAYLIASNGNHQQVLLMLGGTGVLIDTLSPNVATAYPKDIAIRNLAERLRDGSVPWSFYVPISE